MDTPSRCRRVGSASPLASRVTIEIHVTNNSAPAGEWRFGSPRTARLRLRGPAVRSLSRVRSSTLHQPSPAPAPRGEASFDVLFGYEGSYRAAPHGPVPSPNRSRAPSGKIRTKRIRAETTLPARAEVSISTRSTSPTRHCCGSRSRSQATTTSTCSCPKTPASGAIIAASTNGGTDELIELVLPASGEYTLAVHGWSVPNAALRLQRRHMGSAPSTPGTGELLSIDSASPASAVLGASGTITTSWAGLDTGHCVPRCGLAHRRRRAVGSDPGQRPVVVRAEGIDSNRAPGRALLFSRCRRRRVRSARDESSWSAAEGR